MSLIVFQFIETFLFTHIKATKKNIKLIPRLDEISNLIQFVKLFQIKTDQLVDRPNADKVVVITYPRVRYYKKEDDLRIQITIGVNKEIGIQNSN